MCFCQLACIHACTVSACMLLSLYVCSCVFTVLLGLGYPQSLLLNSRKLVSTHGFSCLACVVFSLFLCFCSALLSISPLCYQNGVFSSLLCCWILLWFQLFTTLRVIMSVEAVLCNHINSENPRIERKNKNIVCENTRKCIERWQLRWCMYSSWQNTRTAVRRQENAESRQLAGGDACIYSSWQEQNQREHSQEKQWVDKKMYAIIYNLYW